MGRWSTGNYRSIKNGKVYKYKSSWEAIYMNSLDQHTDVVNWDYEPIFVCYLHNYKVKKYIPDFLVETVGGEKVLIEIKPEGLRESLINSSKREAVLQKCSEENWKYYEWSPGNEILPG